MYPRFSCLVPLVYLLSQVVSCVSVFPGYPFLNVPSVLLFGPLVYLLSQVVSCVSVFLGYPFLNVPSVLLFGPLVYLLSQVVSCVSVFLGYPFLNVTSVFLYGPFSLLTFTGCVLRVRVSQLSVLECTLGFPVWYLWFTYFHRLWIACRYF